ncbi:MAG: SPFH domain-containing protein [Candidatus Theseobacter exili]|nr:SPFH domain-containing protein [Candidatus Theseobacter exili]
MSGGLILVIIVVVVLFIFTLRAVKIVHPSEKGVIERIGKFHRIADSGLAIIFPLIDSLRKIDIREQVVDVPPQGVITKDNVVVEVDAVVYYEVTDPYKYVYNIANYYIAVTKLAQTNLRNVIGDMSLDESLVSRESINSKLRLVLDEATDKWGGRVSRVELQRIEPPADVTDAMHRQMKAERDRRAMILEAEGEKRSAILKSEGAREAAIQNATGEAEAIKRVADAEKYQKLTIAEGEAQAINTVYKAIHEGNPTNDLIAIKYLEALEAISKGEANKVFIPIETSGILASLGGIGELFKESGSKKKE